MPFVTVAPDLLDVSDVHFVQQDTDAFTLLVTDDEAAFVRKHMQYDTSQSIAGLLMAAYTQRNNEST